MNPLAKELNDILAESLVMHMLTDYGRRIYFPKGIISQSAEAKQKAHLYNATIGIATDHGNAMYIPSILSQFADDVAINEVFPYAPTAGELQLRKLWLEEMIKKNPSMAGKRTSLPIVTAGLTHALSVMATLFLDKDQPIIVPDMFWGNYNLIFTEQCQARQISFPLFDQGMLNIKGLAATIDAIEEPKVGLMLNFPNNPTGYSLTKDEATSLVSMLIDKAEHGKKLLLFIDDAYFGLFFEDNLCRESLFSLLCDAHENILAIKGDAATKEDMVWGFRVGFLTYNNKGMTEAQYEALVKKTMGVIRSNISSCSKPAQSILLKAMQSNSYEQEKKAGIALIELRYHLIKKTLAQYSAHTLLTPLPFNSGYFMAFVCAGDAEKLRVHLLNTYGVGTISIKNLYLRLAFSSIDVEHVEDLIRIVYQAAHEVFTHE